MSNADAGLEEPLYPEKGIVESVLMQMKGKEETGALIFRMERELQALIPDAAVTVAWDWYTATKVTIRTPAGIRRYGFGYDGNVYREDEVWPPYVPPVRPKKTFWRWLIS